MPLEELWNFAIKNKRKQMEIPLCSVMNLSFSQIHLKNNVHKEIGCVRSPWAKVCGIGYANIYILGFLEIVHQTTTVW